MALIAALLTAQLISSASAQVHNYSQALELPFMFLEIQQSGVLPYWNRFLQNQPDGWRGDAHTLDGQGPSAYGIDLSGGWYDAGDHIKFTYTTAYTVSTICLGALAFEEGYRSAGQWDIMVQNLRWGTDWLLKAYVTPSSVPKENVLIAQVGDMYTDHNLYWGRPEQQPESGIFGSQGWRPTFMISASNPGSDIAGMTAGALAAFSVVISRPGQYQVRSQLHSFAWLARMGPQTL